MCVAQRKRSEGRCTAVAASRPGKGGRQRASTGIGPKPLAAIATGLVDVGAICLAPVTESLQFLSPGYLIGDKYSIVQAIGSGGMGIVYEARHRRLRQRVAVKMLAPDLVKSADAIARFEREARAAAHLRSPYAARVFDVDTLPNGTPYIVMEFLEGRDLADELAAR